MTAEGIKVTDLDEKVPVVETITEATPIDDSVKQKVENIEDIANKIQDVIDSFSDETEEENKTSAQNYLNKFMTFIQGQGFKNSIKDNAKKFNVSEKRLAKSVIGKVFGVIGDVLGLTIDAVHFGVTGLVKLISTILTGATGLVCEVARKIARVFTFNMTAYA